MYFCRLLSMLFLAFFSSLSWSFGDTLSMPSSYDAPPGKGRMDSLMFKGSPFQLDAQIATDPLSSSPTHSYPLKLKVAGTPVESKQEIFASGEQVLSVSLNKISQLQTVPEIDATIFEQLLFALSRNAKAVSFHFFSLTRSVEIVLDHGFRIETQLEEKVLIRRGLPEPLNEAVAHRLLLATNCALKATVDTEAPTQCNGGTLEKLGKSHVFFEAAPSHSVPSLEWQVQANTSESLELNLNSTTRLILTIDESGHIVKGDAVLFGDPSDTVEEEDKKEDKKKDEGKNNEKQENNEENQVDTPPPPPPPGGTPPGGNDDGRRDDDARGNRQNPDEEETEEEGDEEEDEDEDSLLYDGFVENGDNYDDYYEEETIHHGINRRRLGRARQQYNSPPRRSEHQRRRLEQQTGDVTYPTGPRNRLLQRGTGGTERR